MTLSQKQLPKSISILLQHFALRVGFTDIETTERGGYFQEIHTNRFVVIIFLNEL